jgi:HAD superfamily hydrolase (TIGR01509 family)
MDLAVLVDMDGTLVDSEPEWFAVESEVFARLGASRRWTLADADDLVGNALEVSARMIVERSGSGGDPGQVVEWLVAAMATRLRSGVPLKPGAGDLLARLAREGVPVALVSSSHRRLVDVVVAGLPPGSFAATVAGDEVARSKPHPEPYLTACGLLGVDPSRTVVVEDSPTGARSGEAAGCRVVVVPDRAALPAGHPWVEVGSLTEVTPGWLRGLLGSDGAQHVEPGGAARGEDRGQHPDPG